MELLQKYVGLPINEAVEKIKATRIKCLVKAVAIGETYSGPTFEVIVVRFDPKTQKATEILPAYRAKGN